MPSKLRPARLAAASFLLLLLVSSQGQELSVAPDHDSGVYQPGQPIRWTVRLKDAETSDLAFTVKQGGFKEMAKGHTSFTQGVAQIESQLSDPGWLLLEVSVKLSEAKQLKALGGALVAPEKIQIALPRPDDFDAFWAGKLKELAGVPVNPTLVPAEGGRTNVDYFKITMDNIRGSHIRGQLARPKTGEKLPAMLIVQWAGVYPLQKGWVTQRANEGWLVLNINAHDLPIDEPEKFYQDQAAGPLKDYTAIGNEDRETSYFLRMYLSCFRGVQYLTERPDWDGRTLVVTGGSQGGLQSFVTAGLHPKVTGLMANVPAGCDAHGPLADRLPGWPQWYWHTSGKDEAKVRDAARYYDVVNFASRINCQALVGVGLIDTTCPAPGVFAACNQLKGPKEVVVLTLGEHGEKNGSHRPYNTRFDAWNKALVHSQPVPAP